MASGTTKELSRAISACIPSETLPLPDDLLEIIQAYLDRHHPIEDSDSQRVQDELLGIYQKEVKDSPKRYPVFVAILRQLKPAISTSSRVLQWWETLVIPVLDHLTEEKGLAAETRGILLDILAYDADDEEESEDAITSAVLSSKLLEIWLKKNAVSVEVDVKEKFLEEQIQQVLMEYGRKRPKDFLMTIDKYFVRRDYRPQVLSLLCEFIRFSPPHLHQVMETPLFVNLLRCLQIDTSTTVVSLAMTALVMFLPHIPNAISQHLSALFNIYTRILFWERERVLSPDLQANRDPEKIEDEDGKSSEIPEWEKLTYSFESGDEAVPELIHYFTFLYGLYPINFMSYIRKPGRYLRHANFPGADDIDIQPSEIRERSEPFRHVHLLHQNFYTMTIDSEISDPNRWIRSEASDVVAACMSLCGSTYPGMRPPPGPPPTSELPEIPNRYRNIDDSDNNVLDQFDETLQSGRPSSEGDIDPSWRNTTSTIVASPAIGVEMATKMSHTSQQTPDSPAKNGKYGADSPTLPPQLVVSTSTSHEDIDDSKIFPGSFHQSLPNTSELSFASSQPTRDSSARNSFFNSLPPQTPRAPSVSPSNMEGSGNIASLQREITLLKNDLNFERFLKQQHLSHIGQLRSRHVREATVEAETQNLINSNKGLKNKLEDAKMTTLQMKKESEKSRHHSKKWEAELTTKLRALKEEQKKWIVDGEALRRDLAGAKESNLQLRQLVVASEAKALASRQKIDSIELNVNELEKLHQEVEKLTTIVRTYEAAELDHERAKASEALALTKAEILEMKLKARDTERERAKLASDLEIKNLQSKLEQSTMDKSQKQTIAFQAMIDEGVAATRSRLLEAQRAHSHLLSRFTALQAANLAMQDRGYSDEPLLSGSEDYAHYSPIVPQRSRNRPRGMSNPDKLEIHDQSSPMSTSPNISRLQRAETTRVPPPRPSSQNEGRITQRFNTADFPSHIRSGSDGTASTQDLDSYGAPKIKPTSEVRIYGRGGVQNIGKKEKEKPKKKEDDKKDKKGPSIRGLRGF